MSLSVLVPAELSTHTNFTFASPDLRLLLLAEPHGPAGLR
jgi:hypothetical protein